MPLPVVPPCGSLEDAREPHALGRGVEVVLVLDDGKRGDGQAERVEGRLLPAAFLGSVQEGGARANGGVAVGGFHRCGGDVLELVGHHRDRRCESLNGLEVFVVGLEGDIGDLRRWTVVLGHEDRDPVAHGLRRKGEHAAELAATEHAQGGPGEDRVGHVRSGASALAACSSANRW